MISASSNRILNNRPAKTSLLTTQKDSNEHTVAKPSELRKYFEEKKAPEGAKVSPGIERTKDNGGLSKNRVLTAKQKLGLSQNVADSEKVVTVSGKVNPLERSDKTGQTVIRPVGESVKCATVLTDTSKRSSDKRYQEKCSGDSTTITKHPNNQNTVRDADISYRINEISTRVKPTFNKNISASSIALNLPDNYTSSRQCLNSKAKFISANRKGEIKCNRDPNDKSSLNKDILIAEVTETTYDVKSGLSHKAQSCLNIYTSSTLTESNNNRASDELNLKISQLKTPARSLAKHNEISTGSIEVKADCERSSASSAGSLSPSTAKLNQRNAFVDCSTEPNVRNTPVISLTTKYRGDNQLNNNSKSQFDTMSNIPVQRKEGYTHTTQPAGLWGNITRVGDTVNKIKPPGSDLHVNYQTAKSKFMANTKADDTEISQVNLNLKNNQDRTRNFFTNRNKNVTDNENCSKSDDRLNKTNNSVEFSSRSGDKVLHSPTDFLNVDSSSPDTLSSSASSSYSSGVSCKSSSTSSSLSSSSMMSSSPTSPSAVLKPKSPQKLQPPPVASWSKPPVLAKPLPISGKIVTSTMTSSSSESSGTITTPKSDSSVASTKQNLLVTVSPPLLPPPLRKPASTESTVSAASAVSAESAASAASAADVIKSSNLSPSNKISSSLMSLAASNNDIQSSSSNTPSLILQARQKLKSRSSQLTTAESKEPASDTETDEKRFSENNEEVSRKTVGSEKGLNNTCSIILEEGKTNLKLKGNIDELDEAIDEGTMEYSMSKPGDVRKVFRSKGSDQVPGESQSNCLDVFDGSDGLIKSDSDTQRNETSRVSQRVSEGGSLSDEDEGVYAESLRYSVYKLLEAEGDDASPVITSDDNVNDDDEADAQEDELDILTIETKSSQRTSEKHDRIYNSTHSSTKRSESLATSISSGRPCSRLIATRNNVSGSRPVMLSRKVIRRHKSDAEVYESVSEHKYDIDRRIQLEKETVDSDYGFHLYGRNPMVISTVEPDSIAERRGVKVGDRLISINGCSVVEADIITVYNIVAKGCNSVELGLASGNICRNSCVCSGYLWKQEGSVIRVWKRRWCALKDDNFLYFYRHEADTEPTGAICLTNYMARRSADVSISSPSRTSSSSEAPSRAADSSFNSRANTAKRFGFRLEKYGEKSVCLQADSEEDMSRWAGAINSIREIKNPDSWLAISVHNVGLPALSIKNPDCHGYLMKTGNHRKSWRRRYCVLKMACLYYYTDQTSTTAKGVAHLHGYKIEELIPFNKKFGFALLPPVDRMRIFYFTADNETDFKRWTSAMKKSIERWIKVEDL